MSEPMTLYHLDREHNIHTVPATRDRLMSVSGIFYTSRKDALIAAKQRHEKAVQHGVKIIQQIERELAK